MSQPQAGLAPVRTLPAVLISPLPQDTGDDAFAELEEALTRYSQQMHDYTLRRWSDSRRELEEKRAAASAAGKNKISRRQPPRTQRNPPDEGDPPQSSASTSSAASKS